MSDEKRSMSDALQSAIGRLPVPVVTFDSTGAIRTINGAGSTLFEKERVSRDVYRAAPEHPLSLLLREIIAGEAPKQARVLRFPSGREYEVEASTRSDRGADRLIMFLFRAAAEDEETKFSSWELTSREREVARAVMRGLNSKEIAAELEVSPETVKSHLKSLFSKSGTRNRAEFLARLLGKQA